MYSVNTCVSWFFQDDPDGFVTLVVIKIKLLDKLCAISHTKKAPGALLLLIDNGTQRLM